MDIDNIISNKISSGKKNYKYVFGYMDDFKIKPLHILLPKTSAYVKGYDGETKWMYFVTEGNEVFKKYNDIWNISTNSIKKNLIANPSTIKISENQNKMLR